MDITQFIHSRDIREHLKKIGYQFTSLEAAWLIGDCRSITLGERHEAWRELIRTMPDMKIDSRRLTREWPSLHNYLEKRMAYENRLCETFLTKETGAVYSFSFWLKKSTSDDGYYYDSWDWGELYSDFAKCQADVNKEYHVEDNKSEYVKKHTIRVFKEFVDNDLRKITAEFNAQWELLSIQQTGNVVEDICAEQDDFDGLWFSFPTPFTKGDIVINAEPYIWKYSDGPFVLDSIPPNEEEYIACHQIDADTSDMIATGYFQEDDGSIYREVMHNYMNLEYYRGDMTGIRRILKALSSLMKDKIDISLYSKAYHAILMDEYAKSVAPEHFTDEGMRLVGLK